VQDYRNIALPLNLEEDVWVKAIEFEAGDPTVLHHIIAFAYGPNGVNEFEILNQGIGLGAYAPGNEVNTYPEDAGFPLKAGGGLMLQLHYTTSGRETVDESEIALYLWDEKPARAVLGGSTDPTTSSTGRKCMTSRSPSSYRKALKWFSPERSTTPR
jgi:hypothetical protein